MILLQYDSDNLPYEKVGKNESVCIADEVPFEIPESWEWAKIETISMPIGNKNNQIQSKEVLPTGKIPVVSQGKDLIDGYCNDVSKKIDVLPLVMFGDHTRNVKYIDFEFVIGADGTKFHKILSCNSEYIYYWMLYAAETLRNRGYARHYTLLKECFIPLPPLQEQVRIVSKIKAILPLVEKYGCEESKRVSLDSAFPNLLKKSILQEAIQGKLVPQDPGDEPASVLLERIRAEKQELIAEGKIKRTSTSPSFSEGIILIMKSKVLRKFALMKNCLLKLRKIGNGSDYQIWYISSVVMRIKVKLLSRHLNIKCYV